MSRIVRVGTAGWMVPPDTAPSFPADGSILERQARVFPAVEINTSFYRLHRPETYARWARSVPDDFRFAAKIFREITHVRRLHGAEPLLENCLAGARELGPKLGPLLVQLPPSLVLEEAVADRFFATFRRLFGGALLCEPRHPSWFTARGEELLLRYQVGRVMADPSIVPEAARPAAWPETAYYRLHGSPRMYYSAYSEEYLERLASELMARSLTSDVWCIFDNTGEGWAVRNGLRLLELLGQESDFRPEPDLFG